MSGISDAPADQTGPPAEARQGWDRLRYAGVFALLFLFGTETFLVSPLLPTISDDIGVSEAAAASSVTAYVLAYAVAAPFLGLLSDRFGRRRALLAGTVLFLVSNAAAALSGGLALLVVSRAVAGLAAAAASVRLSPAAAFAGSPAMVAERIGVLRAAGVDVVQLDMAVERAQDRELRRDLVRRLRDPYRSGGRGAW
ncbi:MFS transporter [Streptomyces sp. NPDC046887]|uniref:MFS transporter n=1 Tax=Streptomyces sp. NPDC046887 TaxID=3155472 RepID=UPI0034117DAA